MNLHLHNLPHQSLCFRPWNPLFPFGWRTSLPRWPLKMDGLPYFSVRKHVATTITSGATHSTAEDPCLSIMSKRDNFFDSSLSSLHGNQYEGAKKRPCEPYWEDTSAWESKLNGLLQNENKQELVSREKKDRQAYQQIAALSSRLGLYSKMYAKVVVVSKIPLPNYRFDLDDKRPRREVILPPGLFRHVDSYLKDFISRKRKSVSALSHLSTSVGISAEESLFEEPEILLPGKAHKVLSKRSQQMLNEQRNWQDSPEGRKILEFRGSLPVHKEKNTLLRAISENQVVIVSGETGCGKTTQIPQYILESEIESLRGPMCNVICTQPRKISAISVSDRISTERGEKLGETVGYKVRLDGMKGSGTRLLFCTTGVLLRRLLVDRNLKGITHIIVDEIHERGLNEDFLLIILKELLPRRPELKLILMSATLDAKLFSSYFDGALVVQIPGFTYPVRAHFLEDILEATGYQLTSENQIDDYGTERAWKMNIQALKKRKSNIASAVENTLSSADFKDCNPQTMDSLACWNPDSIGFNLIEHLLCRICKNEKPGAVLVFLTGWDDIISLKDKLQAHPVLGDATRTLLLACHGSMGTDEQKLIFSKPNDGIRKIILATNIAETSITIDDVVFVIDCGKSKETSYDALNNTPCLLPSWISKASAKQRRGRAGRVQPGECYHLYPRCVYDSFSDHQVPEILRTPLHSLCLQIRSLNLGDISEFLSRALEAPDDLTVKNAIEYLKIIGALDENENLTVLGGYLKMLPMEPKLGKMLILGAILNCLDPVLTIVAGLSVRYPFLTPLDKKDLAEAAKAQFSHGYSDHLTLVRAYEGWKAADRDLKGSEYCWNNYLSVHSMKEIDSLRQEFYSLLKDTGLVDSNPAIYNSWSYDEHLLRAILCYGLYPGICSIVHNQKSILLKTMEDGHVNLHYNSVNACCSTIPYPWLVFREKVKVNSVFLRDSTGISDSILLLFGGNITRGNLAGHLKMLDGYLEFFMDPPVAELYLTLREELHELIMAKLLNPTMVVQSYHEFFSALRLLLSGDECNGRFVLNPQFLPRPCQFSEATQVHEETLTFIHDPSVSGPGGENSKGQLQTLLTRAGHALPRYKTEQLNNGQFQSTVEFNGMLITGQPCNNKKHSEKDAAAQALRWLLGRSGASCDNVDHISMLLKRSRKD